MKALTTTGARIIFGIPLLVFSLGHLMNGGQMAEMIYHVSGTPALILNYIAGLGLLLASIAIFINKKARIACLLLALEMLVFILVLHVPKLMGVGPLNFFCDSVEMMKQVGMVHMFKDMAIMGGALAFAGILNE